MPDYSAYSVFVFGAGGRQALPVCKGFYELGCRVVNYCFKPYDTGALTKYRSERIVFDSETAGGLDFFAYGMKLIQTGAYSLVVPLSDLCAVYLSQHKGDIPAATKVAVNDWDILRYAVDKAMTMQVCMDNGIPAPKTIYGDDLPEKLDAIDFDFPVVVKPRTGVGSIGFNIFQTKEHLMQYLKSYGNQNGPLLIQEYLRQGSHPQYRVDLFRTAQGAFKAVSAGKVTRWYPLDGGSGIYVESISDDAMVDSCKRLLDAIGWIGYANIDLVYDENSGTAKIVEINGRTGASIKIDYLCGINISQLMLENELGLPVTDMTDCEANGKLSCFLPDLLWFLQSKDRFHAEPSWFARRGVKDAIFSWDDLLPCAGFLFESVKNFAPAMKKRRRSR